jgi:hypothetical protein
MNGHLSILQWCRANKCPMDEPTCAYVELELLF